MQNVSVRFEEEDVETIESEAEEADESRSDYIRKATMLRVDGEVSTGDGDNAERLLRDLERVRSERDELREELDGVREASIRSEVRIERLEREVERVRGERDSAQARYHEAQGKLKVHNSSSGESSGFWSRVTGVFSG